jgi:hypothetical protein
MELFQQIERHHLRETQINTELGICDWLNGTVRQMSFIEEHQYIQV